MVINKQSDIRQQRRTTKEFKRGEWIELRNRKEVNDGLLTVQMTATNESLLKLYWNCVTGTVFEFT